MIRKALTVTVATLSLVAAAAHGQVAISNHPPAFRFYDVDKRERWMRDTLSRLSGTKALNQQNAADALGRLDQIKTEEAARRGRHGGRLRKADLRALNRELTTLADKVGLG
jgi:hypothetical protein